MAYIINKTDGSILSTVADGQVDQFSTDLTLIGKNYSGFGESLNENFVKLLENFANTEEPSNPIKGQPRSTQSRPGGHRDRWLCGLWSVRRQRPRGHPMPQFLPRRSGPASSLA